MTKKPNIDLDAFTMLFGDLSLKVIEGIAPSLPKISKGRRVASLENTASPSENSAPPSSEHPQPPSKKIDESKLIGQQDVKAKLNQIVDISRVFCERKKRGLTVQPITFHAIFEGNPGTGKTTFARLYAQKISTLGLLSKGHMIETSRDGLVGSFQGETATKTLAILDKAQGGVLFIDEAYSLKQSDQDSYGSEAIDMLVKGIEDRRDDLIVILAGYSEQMRAFLRQNPGLRSRIPHDVTFMDYSTEELIEIFTLLCTSAGYQCHPQTLPVIRDRLNLARKGAHFGNARTARNLFEDCISQQASRLARQELSKLTEAELVTLNYADITPDLHDSDSTEAECSNQNRQGLAMAELNQLIGLNQIKNELNKLANFITLSKHRKQESKAPDLNLHMVFLGNPGTGKTTVARLLGSILKEQGLLSSGHLVETDRSGLVAGYAGQTALKTLEKIQDAMGGILFIDEAYTLYQPGGQDSYGREALDTLLKHMEDHRGKFVVILAGYEGPMSHFLQANPGFKSRFGKIFNFEDFTADELQQIAVKMAGTDGFQITPEALLKLKDHIAVHRLTEEHFANAREVRQVLENAYQLQAARLTSTGDIEALAQDILNTLTALDFP